MTASERPTAAARSHYAKGIVRRTQILDATVRLMTERGFKQTSLRAIGRELGLQPAHILHYFGSREGLLEAVVSASDDRWSPQDGDTVFDTWLRLVGDNAGQPGLVHLYTAFAAEAADSNHPSRAFFQSRWDRLRRAIERELERGSAEGRYRLRHSPRDAATALIALSDGLQLQWLVDRSLDMEAAMRAAIDLVVRAGAPPLQPDRPAAQT